MYKKLGGDRARQADPNQPKGYPVPYNVMLSSKGGLGIVWNDGIYLPRKPLHVTSLLSWKSKKLIHCFALLACTIFALPRNLSPPQEFSRFYLTLSPISLWEE